MGRLNALACFLFYAALVCVAFVVAIGFLTVQLVKGLIYG